MAKQVYFWEIVSKIPNLDNLGLQRLNGNPVGTWYQLKKVAWRMRRYICFYKNNEKFNYLFNIIKNKNFKKVSFFHRFCLYFRRVLRFSGIRPRSSLQILILNFTNSDKVSYIFAVALPEILLGGCSWTSWAKKLY